MTGPGQTLFEFVRHWSRRSSDPEQGRLVITAEAVHSLSRRGVAATVNAVAHEIGIDQSGASRLIRAAVDAGHLAAATAATDGRRREVTVTAAGQELLSQAHAWQEQIFTQLTEDWTADRRREFQQAMVSLMERSWLIATA